MDRKSVTKESGQMPEFNLGGCIGVAILLSVSCKTTTSKYISHQKFAMMDTRYSILPDLQSQKKDIPVCLGLINFDKKDREKAEDKFKGLIKKAANSWTIF